MDSEMEGPRLVEGWGPGGWGRACLRLVCERDGGHGCNLAACAPPWLVALGVLCIDLRCVLICALCGQKRRDGVCGMHWTTHPAFCAHTGRLRQPAWHTLRPVPAAVSYTCSAAPGGYTREPCARPGHLRSTREAKGPVEHEGREARAQEGWGSAHSGAPAPGVSCTALHSCFSRAFAQCAAHACCRVCAFFGCCSGDSNTAIFWELGWMGTQAKHA